MATFTKAQIATKVLQRLNVVGANEAPSDEDSAFVQEAYTAVYDELAELGLVTWGASDSIPGKAMFSVRELVAQRVLDDFVDRATVEINPAGAEADLRRLTNAKERPYRPAPVDYF